MSPTRFASQYGHLVCQVRPEIAEHYATGVSKVIQSAVFAEFKPGGLQAFERELVLGQWNFHGSYQELDEVTTVQPDYRIGVFDSELEARQKSWDDNVRIQVEEALVKLAEQYPHVMVLPRTMVPPPWPKYDDFKGTVGQLLKRLDEDGHDLRLVLIYEQANQNRDALVNALESRIDGFELEPEPEEEEVVA